MGAQGPTHRWVLRQSADDLLPAARLLAKHVMLMPQRQKHWPCEASVIVVVSAAPEYALSAPQLSITQVAACWHGRSFPIIIQ